MQKLMVVLAFMACFLQAATSFSQDDSISTAKPTQKKPLLCQIKMQDGSSYQGFIEKQTDSLLFVKSSSGVLIHIPKHLVTSVDFINGHTTKDSTGNLTIHIQAISHHYYVLSSNAFLMKKGEVYGSSSYFLLYNINYAFNQHFSLGISSSIIAAPIALRLKTNFEIAHKLYLGVDGLFGSGSWLNSKSYGGGGVVKLTYGDTKTNFTALGGYGDIDYYIKPQRRKGYSRRSNGHYQNYQSAIIGAAFSYAISEKIYFVGEAFAAPQVNLFTLSPAIRTNFKQNFSWVFGIEGLLNATSGTSTPLIAFPYIGFSFRL
jgi:hypothetical protein